MHLAVAVVVSLVWLVAAQDQDRLSNAPAKSKPDPASSGWEKNILSGITDADYNRPNGLAESNEPQQDIIAPEDMVFVAYSVKNGDHVKVGDSVMAATLNGQQVTITSGMHGIVRNTIDGLSAGDMVHKGERLALISRPPIQKMTLFSGIIFIILISILAFVMSIHRFDDERIKSLATAVSSEHQEYTQVRHRQLPEEGFPDQQRLQKVSTHDHRSGLPSLSRAAFASGMDVHVQRVGP